MKINIHEAYSERLQTIREQIRKACKARDWPLYFRLRSEREQLRNLIAKKDSARHTFNQYSSGFTDGLKEEII